MFPWYFGVYSIFSSFYPILIFSCLGTSNNLSLVLWWADNLYAFWRCFLVGDKQPLPFYLRPGAYLLDSPTESSWYKLDRWRHSWESGKSNLVCGIPSRIPVLNDCDELQTPKGWALVTNAKESMDSTPTWLRTDRWLAVLWQSIGPFSLRGWDVAIDKGDASRRLAMQWQRIGPFFQED